MGLDRRLGHLEVSPGLFVQVPAVQRHKSLELLRRQRRNFLGEVAFIGVGEGVARFGVLYASGSQTAPSRTACSAVPTSSKLDDLGM